MIRYDRDALLALRRSSGLTRFHGADRRTSAARLARMSGMPGAERAGDWIADRVALVAVVAVALGLLVPSSGLASDSNVLLAALVLFTAAQIDPRRLSELRRRAVLI